MLQGVKLKQAKAGETRPREQLPITPAILRLVKGVWEAEGVKRNNIMLWAVCCTGLSGLLWLDEATVTSRSRYHPEAPLEIGRRAPWYRVSPGAGAGLHKGIKVRPLQARCLHIPGENRVRSGPGQGRSCIHGSVGEGEGTGLHLCLGDSLIKGETGTVLEGSTL